MVDPTDILLIRLKSIGDVVLTLPAVHQVRDHFPRARLRFLTSIEHTPLLQGFAGVDEVLAVDRALYRRKNPFTIGRATLALVGRLRRLKFSLVVDFQGYGETALLTRLTGAPERWGSVYRPGRRWAYTRGIPRNNQLHPAESNLALLAQCGLPQGPVHNEFVLPNSDVQSARAFFGQQGFAPEKPTLFLQPFTSSPHKNWPLEKYLALARHFQQQQVQVLFGGGPSERTALALAASAGYPVAAGTPLLTTAGLMKLSTVIVGGDTGVLHLAVALGKRVLMLLRSSGGGDALPFGHRDWVVMPDGAGDVSTIELERVMTACAAALRETGRTLCEGA